MSQYCFARWRLSSVVVCRRRRMFNLFLRLCRKDDILRKTRSTLLPFVATKSNVASTKSNVASTLLPVWTGLYAAGGRAGLPPGASVVGRPTLHGGPVRLRPVRTTRCFKSMV